MTGYLVVGATAAEILATARARPERPVVRCESSIVAGFARVIGYGLVDERDLGQYTAPCAHGWPVKDCRCCTKLADECDWGSCNRTATATIDGRLTCARCAPMARDVVKCRAWSAAAHHA